MLFNSVEFAVFVPVVFVLYWFVTSKSIKLQNVLLLVASYIFYGWWDWRFLFLIAFSSLVDFLVGVNMAKSETPNPRKALLLISITTNIGLLGFFKYYNFFIESLVDSFTLLGNQLGIDTLRIILPVGISFYTFQTLSYSIDIYRKRIEPTRDIVAFFSFVSFFPQLVAGPIERASHLLPQFLSERKFNYDQATDGMRQILWGLFKKVVIADNCAELVNDIFANSADHSGSTLLLGAILFAFQIYGDFSGYSDMAIGTARLFGFDLMQNFAYPYFSRDIAEFWRRWHISLSTWFRDYVYIPLGGSRGTTGMRIRNTFVIFLVSGLWHGANWTFVVWGFVHACYFLPLLLTRRNRNYVGPIAEGRVLPTLKEVWQISSTFLITTLAWVFFRAENIHHAYTYITGIFTESLVSVPQVFPKRFLLLLVVFTLVEWLQKNKLYAFEIKSVIASKYARWGAYYAMILAIFLMGNFDSNYEFIYFQF